MWNKKYVIYGMNRIAKDFMYIFDKLEIAYFVDDITDCRQFLGKMVYPVEHVIGRDFDAIIICDFDKTMKIKKVEQYGFQYGKDYYFEEDLFYLLDKVKVPTDKELIVWGTGRIAKKYFSGNTIHVSFYVDSNEKKDFFDGNVVKHPDFIKDWSQYFVIIAVKESAEIEEYLSSHNLKRESDFAKYDQLLCFLLLRKTLFDKQYYNFTCRTMLNHLEVLKDGETCCCCTTFMGIGLGNMMKSSVEDVWNSTLHKILCLSTENHTYSFCDKNMCPLFVNKKPSSQNRLHVEDYHAMETMPKVVAVGYDSSCNLMCSTCRDTLCIASGEEAEKLNEVTDVVIEKLLPTAEFLVLAGDGEVFVSKSYERIYRSDKVNDMKYIRILSNGTLFSKSNWEKFATNKLGKIMLTFSIDAATKETYEKIRRNGNFDILKKNMEFASELRREGKVSFLRLNFVVQRGNYQEMIMFVDWAEKLGADAVFFTKILNWGTFTEEEFKEISMMEEDGTTPKRELIQVLENPVMKKGIVDLGTIQYMHDEALEEVIENYYMWELEKKNKGLFI